MTSCCHRRRMRWSGATGAIARCKTRSTGYVRKPRAAPAWRWTCGEKPKGQGVTKLSTPYMRYGLPAATRYPCYSLKIIRYTGEKITHEESERRLAAGNAYIFGLDERYSIDGSTRKNTARYINHSCAPNCQTEQFGRIIWIVAMRDIQAGEELTYNYGYELNDEPAEPCHCGAKHCCGYILGPQYWDCIKQLAPQQ